MKLKKINNELIEETIIETNVIKHYKQDIVEEINMLKKNIKLMDSRINILKGFLHEMMIVRK